MAAKPTPTGINGRSVAISPRVVNYQQFEIDGQSDMSGGGAGVIASLFCGGADSPFLLCDGSPRSNEVDFDINPTGVYVAVHTKQWNLACERIKVYPREASTWVVRYGTPDAPDAGCEVGSSSADRGDRIAAASPQSGSVATTLPLSRGRQTLRWRMLPIHAAILFGAPSEVLTTLIKAYPAGCSAHDDQGMLPLHLAFRSGSSEAIVLILLDAYPEAIERVDCKGRLPSMLAPKTATSYSDTIGEAFVKGPAYYYWASRVATADRVRSEIAMTKQIRQLEDKVRMANDTSTKMLDKTERQLMAEIESLSVDNVELKERLVWYETKYDGAEEKEKVLVDHTNSLAERLRLTSLSEEHLATKLAKIEARLRNKETELEQVRSTAGEVKEALNTRVKDLEQTLARKDHRLESLTQSLEKKILESNEVQVRFEKERELFEKQIDASKECLMELIASSKEDKRMFDEGSKDLRREIQALQSDVQRASVDERRMFETDSAELRQQLTSIQNDVRKALVASSNRSVARALEERLDNMQREVTNHTLSFMSRVDAEAKERRNAQHLSTKKIEDQLDSLQKQVANTRSFMRQNANCEELAELDMTHPHLKRNVQNSHLSTPKVNIQHSPSPTSNINAEPVKGAIQLPNKNTTKVNMPPQTGDGIQEENVEPFDTYISTKSNQSPADQSRDDTECFSHLSDVDTATALGELTEEQRLALEQLDLGGTKEEIAIMLARVPGLTMNQVNLLVDVASSLTV